MATEINSFDAELESIKAERAILNMKIEKTYEALLAMTEHQIKTYQMLIKGLDNIIKNRRS